METVCTVKDALQTAKYDNILVDLYGEEKLSYQKQRYLNALQQFVSYFGNTDISIFSAPGRTEIGGNHTDHQGGKVLAAAINLDGIGIAHKTVNRITVKSDNYPIFEVDVNDLEKKEEEKNTSKGLVRGILKGFKNRGYAVGGFELYMTSDVLSGSGLSSSAMFEALIGVIINEFYNDNAVSPIELAQISQYAENEYFGKPCGLMDQMAVCVGGFVYIDFNDVEKPFVEKINFDVNTSDYELCIVDTRSSHDNLTDEYAAIPNEMKLIASHFSKNRLCEVDEEAFYMALPDLRRKYGDRCVLRAMHFFEENHVVDKEKQALEKNDISLFLHNVQMSGNSSFKYLQNIYSNKHVEEQGVSFALGYTEHIIKEKGVCRVHGGGFAGTIEVFLHKGIRNKYEQCMNAAIGEGCVHTLRIRTAGAVKVL